MKIVILSDFFPPNYGGGAEKIAYNSAHGLRSRGEEVFVVTTVLDQSKEGTVDDNGVTVFNIYTPDYHERWKAYRSLNNRKVVSRIKNILDEVKPDIVHAHNIHKNLSYYSLKIAKKGGAKVFLTAHDAMLFHYGKLIESTKGADGKLDYRIGPFQQIKRFKKRYNPFRNIIIKKYLRYVDKIFSVSEALKSALNQNNIKNVEVLHNGIDVNIWSIDDQQTNDFKSKYKLNNKKIILFGGRINALKGGDLLVEAMKTIKQKIPGVVLLILGKENSYLKGALDRTRETGVKVVLTGWISGSELKAAYHSCDVVVVPSTYLDPFPTVGLEAMASKKPVIATCFGGMPEMVLDGITGYVIDPNNTEAMAEMAVKILKDSRLAGQLGDAGYERVINKFSLSHQIDQYLAYYDNRYNSKGRR